MKQTKLWMIAAILTFCSANVLTACSNEDNAGTMTDYAVPMVWLLSQLLTGHADTGVFLAQPVTDILVFAFTGIYLYKTLSQTI